MRRLLPILALTLTACAAPKRTERTELRTELRTDTFRALLAEQLSVSLDDVIILPPDSLSPTVIARRAEIKRISRAELTRESAEQVAETVEQTTETTRSESSPLKKALTAAVIALLFCLLGYKCLFGR